MRNFLKLIIFYLPIFVWADSSIQNQLLQKYKNFFGKSITINSIKVQPISQKKIKGKLTQINFSTNQYYNHKGNFWVEYKLEGVSKKYWYKYSIDATIMLYLSNKNIKANTKLNSSMFSKKKINFKKLQKSMIHKNINFEKYILKRSIPKDKILKKHYLRAKPLISKNSYINAFIKEDGLTIKAVVKAMQDGFKGETINVKLPSNKKVKAKIVSKNQVLIP